MQALQSHALWATTAAHSAHNWGLYVSLAWLPSFFTASYDMDLSQSSLYRHHISIHRSSIDASTHARAHTHTNTCTHARTHVGTLAHNISYDMDLNHFYGCSVLPYVSGAVASAGAGSAPLLSLLLARALRPSLARTRFQFPLPPFPLPSRSRALHPCLLSHRSAPLTLPTALFPRGDPLFRVYSFRCSMCPARSGASQVRHLYTAAYSCCCCLLVLLLLTRVAAAYSCYCSSLAPYGSGGPLTKCFNAALP